VKQFLSEYPNVSIHYLPPYHPKLNYQERLWHMMRYEETTNTYYETMVHLEVAVFSRSQRWKPRKLGNYVNLLNALTIALLYVNTGRIEHILAKR